MLARRLREVGKKGNVCPQSLEVIGECHCAPGVACGVEMNVGRVMHKLRVGLRVMCRRDSIVVLFLSLVIGSTLSQAAPVQCQYPNIFAPPENRVGEFEVPLVTPDYSDANSVQRQLAYSLIWSRLLIQAIGTRSNGRCSAIVSASLFPNLRVLLIDNVRIEGQQEAAPNSCLRSLENILIGWQPSKADIAEVSLSEAHALSERMSRPLTAATEASNILRSALEHIYVQGSVMQALVSVEPKLFRSLDSSEFLNWLATQRSSSQIKLKPLVYCPVAEDSHLSIDEPEPRLPHSGTIPRSVIHIELGPAADNAQRNVRYVVIVGEGTARGFSKSNPPAIAKYCNREHEFSDNSGSHRVTIRCLRTVQYDDGWTVFFCDPANCKSSHLAQSVMTAIASDPVVIELSKRGSPNGEGQGPYAVEVVR